MTFVVFYGEVSLDLMMEFLNCYWSLMPFYSLPKGYICCNEEIITSYVYLKFMRKCILLSWTYVYVYVDIGGCGLRRLVLSIKCVSLIWLRKWNMCMFTLSSITFPYGLLEVGLFEVGLGWFTDMALWAQQIKYWALLGFGSITICFWAQQ